MILSCPNCYSQFNVEDDAIGVEGRKVKCSSCKEIWVQDPDPDWLADKLAEQTEKLEQQLSAQAYDEVESVEEVGEDDSSLSSDDQLSGDRDSVQSIPNLKRKRSVASYGIAASVLLLFLSYLFLNSASIMQRDPAWLGFYGLFGLSIDFPEDVVFDQVIAEADGHSLVVKGSVANLSSELVKLYPFEVVITDKNSSILASWTTSLERDYADAEEVIKFETSHAFNAEAGDVHLRFILDSKIASEGVDNIPVHH